MAFFKSNPNSYPDPYTQPVDRKRIIIFGGIGLALLLGLILFAVTLLSGDAKGTYEKMLAKHTNLQQVVKDSQPRIRNSALSKVNSSTSLLLSSDSVTLNEQLKKKFNTDKLSDSAKKQSADTELTKKLEEAVLLDKFDVAYRNLLREKINDLMLLALEVQDNAGGKEFTPVMDKYLEDLKSIDEQLGALNL